MHLVLKQRLKLRRYGRMAMLRIANPSISVRLRVAPPQFKELVCPGGEIGRHKGFKIPRGFPRAGSSPALGTIIQNNKACFSAGFVVFSCID